MTNDSGAQVADSSRPAGGSRRGRRIAAVVGVVVLLVVVAAVGVNLWLNSGDPEAEFELSTDIGTGSDTDGGSATPDASTDDSSGGEGASLPEGDWVIEQSPSGPDTSGETGVGYRIIENVPVVGDEVITARTTTVEGTLEASSDDVLSASVSVDMASLSSGNSVRDDIVAASYLETEEFPTAEFALEAVASGLDTVPPAGEPFALQADGELTIRGITRPVSFDADAVWTAELIEIVGSVDILLTDVGIEPPSLAGRNAEDSATVEFKLRFVPA